MSQELHNSLMGKQALNTRITTPAHTTSGLQKIPADAEPDEPLRPRGTWLERLGAAPWWFTKYSAGQELAEPKHHCAIAGLAALAFLGAGHTSKVGKYKDHVRRALEYLQSQQDEHGCFGPVRGPGQGHYIYDQAICTLALAEAGAMTREAAWYYGTLTTFQQGGELWKNWNEAMKKTLVKNQCKGGDEDGSWDPGGDYYGYWFGGRVYSTALGALCLEVYYRYLPLYR